MHNSTYYVMKPLTYILFLLFLTSYQLKTTQYLDKIEKIEVSFTHDGWWHKSFINIKNDSIIAFFNEDDSIGRINRKINNEFVNSFDTLTKNIIGNFIDTIYKKCDNETFEYRININRTNSNINYHGGNCKKFEQLDKFVEILIEKTININLPPPPPEPAKYAINFNSKTYEFYSDKDYKMFLDSLGVKIDTTGKIQ